MIGNNESIEISIKLVSFVLEAMFNLKKKKVQTALTWFHTISEQRQCLPGPEFNYRAFDKFFL